MNRQKIVIHLDELSIKGSGGNYLVVNTIPNIDSWRFSHETAMRLCDERATVKFLDLSFLDPSTNFFYLIRKIIRNNLQTRNYERRILDELRVAPIEICKVGIFQKIRYFLDLSGVSNQLKAKPVISVENEIAIKSWLAVSSGSTHYKWDVRTRVNLFRANRSIKWTNKILDIYAFDSSLEGIFTFNGRFPVDSTLLSRAKVSNTQTILFDGGSLANNNRNRIQYFYTSPHNPTEIRLKIQEYWESTNATNRHLIATNYLNDISEGKRSLGTTFNWNPNSTKSMINARNSVVFFASSDWEQGAIMKWLPSTGFRNQFEVVDALLDICSDLEIDLLIKLHPIRKNFKGQKSIKAEEEAWKSYSNLSRVQIISETEKVNPSGLVADSLINVGFRTSITAQSIYLGRNTAICAHVPWVSDDVNFLYTPDKESLKTAIERAVDDKQKLQDSSSLNQWGYYQAVCGSEMKFSEIRSGQFRILKHFLSS